MELQCFTETAQISCEIDLPACGGIRQKQGHYCPCFCLFELHLSFIWTMPARIITLYSVFRIHLAHAPLTPAHCIKKPLQLFAEEAFLSCIEKTRGEQEVPPWLIVLTFLLVLLIVLLVLVIILVILSILVVLLIRSILSVLIRLLV